MQRKAKAILGLLRTSVQNKGSPKGGLLLYPSYPLFRIARLAKNNTGGYNNNVENN